VISLIELLKEVANTPKAIFMSGPAGSGKTHIRKKLGIEGFEVINVDDDLEVLLKSKLGKVDYSKMTPDELSQAGKLMSIARKTTKEKEKSSIERLQNIIIDGTGAASGPLLKKKSELEDLGYKTFMVLIYVSPITSLERNRERDRSLPINAILSSWKGLVSSIDTYKNEFGNNIVLINNDPEDANTTFTDPQSILKQFPTPKGKPKTPEEIAKSREKKAQLNKDIQDLLKIERGFDTFDQAKSQISKFLQ